MKHVQLSSVQVGEVTHLGSGSAGKCEENINVKRIISQFFSPFFEVVISQVWLDARPSNFDGRLSITPRFYPCKVTARVRNKNFTLYNMLNSHLSHSKHDRHFPSEETHMMIPRTCGICQTVSEISSWKELKLVPSFSHSSLLLA